MRIHEEEWVKVAFKKNLKAYLWPHLNRTMEVLAISS